MKQGLEILTTYIKHRSTESLIQQGNAQCFFEGGERFCFEKELHIERT